MSYIAEVFNIMIASPSDVSQERKIIRDIIHEWNVVHSFTRRLVLLPIGWETHSSPEMGTSPQSIINKQLLEKCDLLVGVFWTRIGTATSEYASGTVEEIERHIGDRKPTMLYFSNQDVKMDTVDFKQYDNLKEFKLSCQSRGLYDSYNSIFDFKEMFSRQLQLKLNEDSIFNVNATVFEEEVENKDATQLTLTRDAQVLLKEASLDSSGVIIWSSSLEGVDIQTNGKHFITLNNPREEAKWVGAMEELTMSGCITPKSDKNIVFILTHKGYKLADKIDF